MRSSHISATLTLSTALAWIVASGSTIAPAPKEPGQAGVAANLESLPAARISGPIPSTARPGDASHNYPFFTTRHFAEEHDYVEEEFYVEGLAVEYIGPPGQTATVAPGGPYPYKTRAIVRRPKSARRFNGTVILEWTNVGAGFGIDNDWYWSHEHLMRRGFAHIGVIVEPNGIDSTLGLKQWNPARYGTLDVAADGKFTAVSTLLGPLENELSYSIFSQVARAAKNPAGASLLGNLKAKNVVATGHSRSAGRLLIYYDRVHPVENTVDGFVFHGGIGGATLVRTDIRTPAWKFMAENDVLYSQAAFRQPDSSYLRTWEVAGASHQDWDLSAVVSALAARDLPSAPEPPPCERPELSRVPSRLVQDALYDWMKLWIERGTPPPHGPPIVMSSVGTGRGARPNTPPDSVAARDEHGNALGGIRLAQFAVATARNTGLNPGPGNCWLRGSFEAFDGQTVARLYPTRAKYITEVHRLTDANLKAGYITKEGAEQTKKDAARLKIAGW